MGKLKDLTGRRFGRLIVIKRGPNEGNKTIWICKCDCGTIRSMISDALLQNKSKSCGCLHQEIVTKHGDWRTRFYNTWGHMIQRCLNPKNPSYKYYGGRGITFCDRWLKYENFKKDMYDSYLEHFNKHNGDTSIDRKDNNGNYELSNCHWATQREQNCNQRRNKLFVGIYTIPGPSYGYREVGLNRAEFARKYNLHQGCVNACVRGERKSHKGWIFKLILKEDTN